MIRRVIIRTNLFVYRIILLSFRYPYGLTIKKSLEYGTLLLKRDNKNISKNKPIYLI